MPVQGRLPPSLDTDLPAKSSQFSLGRPTKLDKIKNLYVEAFVAAIIRRSDLFDMRRELMHQQAGHLARKVS